MNNVRKLHVSQWLANLRATACGWPRLCLSYAERRKRKKGLLHCPTRSTGWKRRLITEEEALG